MKTLLAAAPPRASDRLAGPPHVGSVGVVADHLQREIGLHRRADVERAVVKQRPAAMSALDAAQIDADLLFERQIVGFAEEVAKQHIFRRDRRVGLEFETPVAIRALAGEQRGGRRADAPLDFVERMLVVQPEIYLEPSAPPRRALTIPAALYPERTAPSIVAGNPVCVQSPASTTFS